MANRYWVGGSGNWDGLATAHWSATAGGVGGASLPTTADNVLINDASAGAGTTVTVIAVSTVGTLNLAGFTGTFAGLTSAGFGGIIVTPLAPATDATAKMSQLPSASADLDDATDLTMTSFTGVVTETAIVEA